jgi:putative peptide zinc metalloprotease protein
LTGVIGIVQMAILVLPAVAIVATFWMLLRRATGAVWARTEGKPAARGAFVVVTSAAAAFLAYIWWPNGDYRPIQPGERGTLQGAVQQLAAVPSGRPALTKERAEELGGAPLLSSDDDTTTPTQEQPRTPTTSTPTTTATSTTTPATTSTTETTTTNATTTTTENGVTVSTPVTTTSVTTP